MSADEGEMREVLRPPHSDDAEEAVLGAMLMGNDEAIKAARGALQRDDFWRGGHAEIFDALGAISDRGVAVDAVALVEELRGRGTLDRCGGHAHIAMLMDAVGSDANILHHAKIVHAHARRRRLAEIGRTLQEAALQTASDTEELARRATELLLPHAVGTAAAGYRLLRESIWPLMEEIEARGQDTATGRSRGVLIGYPQIDNVTHGFRPGETIFLGGVAKSAKSAFCLNVALNVAIPEGTEQAPMGVGYVSAEMTSAELTERALCTLSRIPASRMASGRLYDDDWPRLARAAGLLSHAPIYVDDGAFPDLDTVIARTTALKAAHPDIMLIVVDYLQLVVKRLTGRRGDEEIAAVTRGLKALAKHLGVVLLAPAQLLIKEIAKRASPRPEIQDFHGGSSFVQDGNFVGMIFRPTMYGPSPDPLVEDPMEINFAYNRRVAPWTAYLGYDGACTRVYSPSR